MSSTSWARGWKTVVLLVSCAPLCAVAGTVATDGTLGRARTLPGPRFTIGPDLGQQRGGNLFHSFRTLNLDAGESATFTGPASVKSVFARVTAAQPSSIDGTLRCTIPNANFYLVNPAGVMFGPDAALDVKGSFAVTTADTIKLGGSGSFNASHPVASTLTTAAPAAFGFLSSQPTGVTIQGTASRASRLTLPQGKGLLIVSGPIQIIHGQLVAPGGQANLIAVASPGKVSVNAADVHSTPGVSAGDFADISLTRNSQINLDGPAGGGFLIRANNLTLDASSITSTTLGPLRGFEGDAIAGKTLRLTGGSSISNTLSGPGHGGGLTIAARDIVLDAQGAANVTTLASVADPRATGQAGNLAVHARTVRVLAGAQINASTSGPGRGGNLSLTAASLTLDDRGDLAPGVNATGVFIESSSSAAGAGAAGDLTVHAGTVRVLAGAVISAATFGPGRGGNLSLTAASLTLDERGDLVPTVNTTGIFSESISSAGRAGAAGDLTVHAGTVRVLAGAQINASTGGPGRSGNLSLTASSLTLDDRGDPAPSVHTTGVFSESISSASGAGAAGDLTVHAGTVRVLAGAQIAASTAGPGRGGTLSLTASSLTLDDRGDLLPGVTVSGVFATSVSSAGGAGAAGDLTVRAGTVRVLAGAAISASTFGSGAGGSVAVGAGTLQIDGSNRFASVSEIAAKSSGSGTAGSVRISGRDSVILSRGGTVAASATLSSAGEVRISSNGSIMLDGGQVSATAQQAAGNVIVTTPLFLQLVHHSLIATRSVEKNGGNITLNALELSLRQSRINADAPLGIGGNIAVAADATPGLVFTGPVAQRNMTATGQAGVSGNIQNGPANSDIAKSVTALPASLNSGDLTLQPQCGQMLESSTFLVQGRGAVADEPGFWQMEFDLQSPTAERAVEPH